MSDQPFNPRTAFSRRFLPTMLFAADDTTAGTLLTYRATGVFQSVWRNMCSKLGLPIGDQGDCIASTTQHLQGNRIPAIAITLPSPAQTGDDCMACWVGLPYLGTCRYFTLAVPDLSKPDQTSLMEWLPRVDSEFQCVPLGHGSSPDPESLFQLIESVLNNPHASLSPPKTPVAEPAWQEAAMRGEALSPVEMTGAKEQPGKIVVAVLEVVLPIGTPPYELMSVNTFRETLRKGVVANDCAIG